ncbi:MAG: DEAD/DEAH box helicase family protein [Acidobacteriaceae bacterium]|nr:DEAD/DEAH box helicase family protein [Acidobacteriaceae bacterium]MBV9499463.1 DEAD/DEAH box helicase family protein [Acidobacteriaceae bacterium]
MPHFGFLQAEWKDIFTAAAKAELNTLPDPRTGCFYARRALELAVAWLYKADKSLKAPYDDNLSALLNEPTFRTLIGQDRYTKARIIKELGNEAVHSHVPITPAQSIEALRELFHFCYWLGRTYARTAAGRPAPGLKFDPNRLPKTSPIPPQTAAQLARQAEEIAQRDAELKLRQQKLDEFAVETQQLNEELARLRADIAEAKRANQSVPDTHDYSETETRDAFIDLLLREAGWKLADTRDREFPITGMPNESGTGWVDYVLWGKDGRPLALVEAKRTKRSIEEGRQKAKLYADCLEKQFGQRPIIYLSNGYEHEIWDDTQYPSRPVQGFRTQDELELLFQRRTTHRPLHEIEIDRKIVDRYYQERAIRKIAEAFETKHVRRALLVMATGAGKTRTVIGLVDLLLRANWIKRVLFLADRVALVNQAVSAFKKHLPSSAPVNLVTEKNVDGRVYVSTYPTMLGLIEEAQDGERRFGPGYFDLVIIDEAHRSVYQRYGAIFEYFDSLLVGLTATPRDETDRDTYKLFHLEPGVPTDAYELTDAVADGYLVPARSVSMALKFPLEGIHYNDLTEEEKREWDEIEWDEDPEAPKPDRVEGGRQQVAV